MSQSNFTLEQAQALPEIGKMRNKWRERMVSVRRHPASTEYVVTIGVPFDGTEPVICVEAKYAYDFAIAAYPAVDVYN